MSNRRLFVARDDGGRYPEDGGSSFAAIAMVLDEEHVECQENHTSTMSSDRRSSMAQTVPNNGEDFGVEDFRLAFVTSKLGYI